MLQFLVQKVGDGQIMMGTDYPHHLGHWDAVEFIRKTPGLSKASEDKILYKTPPSCSGSLFSGACRLPS